MKDHSKGESGASDLQTIACQWVIRHEHGLSPAEQDAFNDWLAESPLHKQAYLDHSRSWDELDRLVGLQKTMHRPPNPDLLDEEWALERGSATRFRLPNWTWGLAACLALFATFLLIRQSPSEMPVQAVAVAAEVPDRIQRLRLDDGSVIELNRGAKVSVEFSETERLVRLVSGEAIFHVEKDFQRPFLVESSNTIVRAVGTVFNVRFSNESIDVLVTEGLVSVEPDVGNILANESAKTLVSANERAIVRHRDPEPEVFVVRMDPQDIQKELIWQPKLIEFNDAPLSEIVSEFNRHNPVRLQVEDEELRQLRMTSIFWTDNVSGFVRLLEAKYGISAIQGQKGVIELLKADQY